MQRLFTTSRGRTDSETQSTTLMYLDLKKMCEMSLMFENANYTLDGVSGALGVRSVDGCF